MSANTFYCIFGWHLYLPIFLMNLICLWVTAPNVQSGISVETIVRKDMYYATLLKFNSTLFWKKEIQKNKRNPWWKNNLFKSIERKWTKHLRQSKWFAARGCHFTKVRLSIATDFIKHHKYMSIRLQGILSVNFMLLNGTHTTILSFPKKPIAI